MKKILFIIFIFIHSVCFGADGDPMLLPLTDTANRLVSTDANKEPAAVNNICTWTTGDGTFITCTDDLDGTGTLDFVADYSDISTNDAATDVTGAELETLTDTSNADLLHAHTGASISGIDISDDTNLAVTAPVVLTDDTISYTGDYDDISTNDLATDVTGAELETLTDTSNADALHVHESAGISNLDHGADNTAASLLDDDHTQYALLAGRSGGQTIFGGTGANEGIFLKGTSNASASGNNYAFYLGAGNNGTTTYPITVYHNGKVGLGGETTPGLGIASLSDVKVHISGTGNSSLLKTSLLVENTGAQGAASFQAYNNADNYFTAQMCGSNYASGLLPNYGFFYTQSSVGATLPLAFATDGTVASGGASPIQFQPGGYHPTNAVSLFLEANGTKKVGIGGEKTPTAQLDVNIANAAYIGFILDNFAAQTADTVQIKDSGGNVIHRIAIAGATNPSVSWNDQLGDIDFIIAGDTEANLLRVDANTDQVRQGDWDTNYHITDNTGDTWWVGSTAGLPFGSMYADDISETVAVAASDTWYEVDGGNFTAGQVNLSSLDSSYRLQVTKAGMYKIDWSTVEYTAAAAQYIEATVGVNGTASVQCVNANETATANKQYGFSGTCILDLAANDYVSLMTENGTSTQDIIVTHGNLTLIQVGGT